MDSKARKKAVKDKLCASASLMAFPVFAVGLLRGANGVTACALDLLWNVTQQSVIKPCAVRLCTGGKRIGILYLYPQKWRLLRNKKRKDGQEIICFLSAFFAPCMAATLFQLVMLFYE